MANSVFDITQNNQTQLIFYKTLLHCFQHTHGYPGHILSLPWISSRRDAAGRLLILTLSCCMPWRLFWLRTLPPHKNIRRYYI